MTAGWVRSSGSIEFLGEQRVLLVLDNCEHVLAAAAAVLDPVLRACPNVSAMVTSREPLGLGGEQVWRMTPLTLPRTRRRSRPSRRWHSRACSCSSSGAAEVRPSFVLDAATAPLVAAICTRLDGLPLAIELAASRTRSLSPQRILAGLDDRFRLLTGGSRTATGRQQTLQASVEWSHQLLSENERTVFRRLAAFAGGFTLDAAEAVAGGPDLDAWEVLDVLTALVDKSLVTFDGERYGLLATLRDFATAQLLGAGETAEVRDRHVAHFLAQAEAATDLVEHQIMQGLIDELRPDHDNLRLALEWSAAKADNDAAARMVSALMFFWLATGHFTEGLMWHRRVLAELPEDPTPARCQVMWGLGHLSLNCAELSNGLGMNDLGQAFELAKVLDDPKMMARPLGAQGCVMVLASNLDPIPALRQATELARASGDLWGVSYALWWEAAYFVYGRSTPAEGQPALDELDEMARQAASTSCLAWNDWIRGAGDWQQGRLAEAWDNLERGMHRSLECAESLIECGSIGLAGLDVLADLGRYDQAEAQGRATLSRAHRTLDTCRQGMIEIGVAKTMVARGDLVAARRELDPIEAPLRAAGLPMIIEWWLWAHGRVALESDDVAAARAAFDEASGLALTQGYPWFVAAAHHHQGVLALHTDDTAAETHFHAALALQVEFGFRVRAAETLERLAQCAVAGESFSEAGRLLGCAQTLRESTGGVRAVLDRPAHERCLAAVRAALGEEAFAAVWAEGLNLSLGQVGAYASRARGERKRPSSGWDSLTPTELQVVGLAATGLTNAQVGEKLFVSPGTVKTHLQNVYGKLGIPNRAALAAEATARGVAAGQ